MKFLTEIITNPFLITGLSSLVTTQVFKLILYTIINRKFDIKRLTGDGGMPSGHSAVVTGLLLASALRCGFNSFEAAMAFFFAIIVFKDAVGVRRQTGKQSVVINKLIKKCNLSKEDLEGIELDEFGGHTIPEVALGILFGIGNAILMYNILPF